MLAAIMKFKSLLRRFIRPTFSPWVRENITHSKNRKANRKNPVRFFVTSLTFTK